MNTPYFSIILVNWNTSGLLRMAIQSACDSAEASGLAVEIIVVDNGSTDDSVAMVLNTFPMANVVENGANLGFSRAVNRGLAARRGRHVILLNTDAAMSPNTLEEIRNALESDQAIGILGACLLNPDGTAQNSMAPFPSLATEILNKSLLKLLFPKKYRAKIPPGSEAPIETDSVIGACLTVRAETLDAIGPLDERFFFFFEETDWCRQARNLGWKTVVAPLARVIHGQGLSSKPVRTDVRLEYYRSRYRYFLKNKGFFQTALLFEGMLIKLMIENLSAAVALGASLGKSERARNRLEVVWTLLKWHLTGCPKSWGLEGKHLR